MTALFDQISARYVTKLVQDFKLRPHQAAAFPGNFGVESGGFTQIQEINPLGGGQGGLGHGQWTGPRRREFEAYLAKRAQMGMSSAPDDFDSNYGMLFRELDGGEGHRVLPKLRQATTVEQATEIVMHEFERPAEATAHLEKRISYAKQALAAFEATGIDADALIAHGRPGVEDTVQRVQSAGQIEALPKLDPQQREHLQKVGRFVLAILAQVISNPQSAQANASLLPLIGQLLDVPVPSIPSAPKLPEPAPKAEPPKTEGVSVARPSVWLSIASLFGAALGMDQGVIGTPLGMGMQPTTTGTLSILAPLATAAIGATGGFAPLAKIGMSLVGGLATSFVNRQKS